MRVVRLSSFLVDGSLSRSSLPHFIFFFISPFMSEVFKALRFILHLIFLLYYFPSQGWIFELSRRPVLLIQEAVFEVGLLTKLIRIESINILFALLGNFFQDLNAAVAMAMAAGVATLDQPTICWASSVTGHICCLLSWERREWERGREACFVCILARAPKRAPEIFAFINAFTLKEIDCN